MRRGGSMPRFAMTGQRSSLKGSRCGIDTVISGNRISMLLAEKSGIALELQATVLGRWGAGFQFAAYPALAIWCKVDISTNDLDSSVVETGRHHHPASNPAAVVIEPSTASRGIRTTLLRTHCTTLLSTNPWCRTSMQFLKMSLSLDRSTIRRVKFWTRKQPLSWRSSTDPSTIHAKHFFNAVKSGKPSLIKVSFRIFCQKRNISVTMILGKELRQRRDWSIGESRSPDQLTGRWSWMPWTPMFGHTWPISKVCHPL